MMLDGLIESESKPKILAKILPPRRRDDVLSRPRLLDYLTQNLDRRLVLVCTPAGYGKTTLLADFAHQAKVPVCWYALSPADADPRVFLEYLIAAVRRRFAGFGERTLQYLQTAGSKDVDAIVGLLLSELHDLTEQTFVIVLDDLHTIDESPAVQRVLNLLIPNLPTNCCCMIASRTIPRIRFSRLVANREAAGLGDTDLRFTTLEIQHLFSRHYKLLIPDEMVEEIAREAEGWIAGIILTSHALWQGLFRGWIRSKRARSPVFEYLATEVFDHQPPNLQEFLLETSILDRLSPASADALRETTDSADFLQTLDEENLFTARFDGADEWYRYHPLFQEFLLGRFRRQDPERHRALQRRAGQLAEAEGEDGVAFEHYLHAGETDRAADLIERVADGLITAGRIHSLWQWCERLPADVLDRRPRLQIARARAALEVGEVEQAGSALASAYKWSTRTDDKPSIASALIWRSMVLRYQGKLAEAIADGRAGLAIAQKIGATALVTDGYRQLGTSLTMQGSLVEAIAALDQSLLGYIAQDDRYNQAAIDHQLGIAWKRLGDTERAQAALDRALDLWRGLGNLGMLAGTLVVIGNLHGEMGRSTEALQALTEAQTAASESGFIRLAGYAHVSLADVYRDGGDYAIAQAHYEQGIELAERVDDRFLVISALEGLARCQRYASDVGLARATIQRARHLASERESPFERGICEDTYGILCLDDGQADLALEALEQATEWLNLAAVRDRARAQLHLAQAHLRSGSPERAAQIAAAALADLPGGAADPLLRAEGRYLAKLLQVTQPLIPAGIADLVKKLAPEVTAPSAAPTPATTEARIQCFTLGRADLAIEGRLLSAGDWPTQKARQLWFYLFTLGPSSRDQIVEALWPDADIDPSVFHTTAHRLRRTLCADCIERKGSLWQINPLYPPSSDDRTFEDLGLRAQHQPLSSGDAAGLDLMMQAVDFYRGPYLEGLDGEWLEGRRRQLEALYLRRLRELVEGLRVAKRYDEVITYAERYLQTSPDDEAIHEATMRTYAALGNRPAALRHYQRYAQQLRDELAAVPSRRLRLLSEQIAQDG